MRLVTLLAKCALLLAAAVMIGLPLIHDAQVLTFLCALTFVSFGALRPWPAIARGWPWLAGAFALAATGAALPSIQVQEGHNVFLVDGGKHEAALTSALPASIYASAKAQFLSLYPGSGICSAEKSCWQAAGSITSPFAFTPDGALQRPAMTRVIDFPQFAGLGEFRGGFKNSSGTLGTPSTNWYDGDAGPGDPVRASLPFFVVYEIPASLAGQQLCTQGDWYVQAPSQAAEHRETRGFACRPVRAADAGTRVYGLSIDPRNPLAIYTRVQPTLAVASHVAGAVLRLAGAVLLVLLAVAPDWVALSGFAAITGPAALAAGPAIYASFQDPIYLGGSDTLTHWAYGQRVLQAAASGDWWEAARGVEDVFYYMPGYRYFHALEMVLFGDSAMLSFAVLLVYPWAIALTAYRLGGGRLALLGLPVAYVAFGQAAMVLPGWSEGVAYPLAVIALAALLALPQAERTTAGAAELLLAALLLAGVVLMRPNLGPMAVLALAVTVATGPRSGMVRRASAAVAGLAPIGLMLAHNLAFGHVFALATSSATTIKNFSASPAVYARAAWALLTGNVKSPDVAAIFQHQGQWLAGGGGQPVVVAALLVAGAAVGLGWPAVRGVIAGESRRREFRITLAAWLGLQVPLAFWEAKSRFGLLAGVIGYLLVVLLAYRLAEARGLRWPGAGLRQALTGGLDRLGV